ncbi:mucin-5AC isoform X3 [Folsomia candida]|uniref:mucin-5AC isoform X3 n=1 Tax=Folsomia candida TaxID=158441 RepID=UPI001604AD6C|nr:mucin-5AC isoform X3 [Folsomia candida]
MATTSTINHEDIHQAHSVGVTLHQLAQQMTNCTSSSVDSDSAKSSLCSDATPEDLIFFHTQSNPIMEGFLLEGDTGSSRESLANLLDEGLGTSLDGTESEATHPTLGRNDSGVFSSDEMSGIPQQNHIFPSSSCSSSSTSMTIQIPQPSGNVTPNSSVQVQQHKKFTNRQKNASPNRQAGPQRCVMGKCSSSLGGIVLKCPSSPQLSSPHSLKEQLELIHQIIQQTTEESAVIYSSGIHQHQGFSNAVPTTKQSLPPSTTTTTILNGGVTSNSKSSSPTAVDANKNKATSQVGGVGSGSNHNGGGGAGDINVILGGGDENSSTQNPTGKAEDKPVECAICCRRFKNTPALNGHMRLHGGYFKKETDGRKKEPATKETQGAPLQTASVSVRALIEEKIIQRQRNAGSLSSSASSTPKTSPPTSSPTTPTKKPLVPLQSSPPPPLSSSANTSQFHQADVHNLPKNNSSNPTLTFTSSNQHCQPLPFEDSHAEYLLEEEVFNKVSSICPDSFFSSIDESMLCESGIGTGSDSSQISADFFNYSLFTTEPATPTASSNDNPFTPLPTMDPIFFTPAPGSVHSQSGDLDSCLADSPSFIYPTPPASLESHNALQSPLFPFPFPFETTSQNVTHANLMANSNQQLVMVSPVATSSNGMKTVSINCANNNNNGTPSNLLTTSISALGASSHNLTQTSGLLLTTSQMQAMEQCSISGSQPSFSFTLGRETDGNCEQSNISNHSLLYDTNSSRLPVSLPSPSISAISSSPSTMITTSSYTLGGVSTGNEPCLIMGDSLEESFRSPHRIFTLNVNPNSLISKVPKRKGYATLASNLRPQTSQSPPHFTPYPILSPVRSAPGLFWTFSAKLTHVDDNRKDRPRINLGINFQAVIPPLEQKHTIKNNYMLKRPEDLLWSPDSISNCFKEDVEKYLEFACCSAIPGGGRNIEYALHILNLCNGDINVAMLLLMNPEPKLPVHLFQYKYPEREKWTRQEILQFQESLVRHGKDFLEVSKELVTKSGEACVSFYQLWKKVCPNEYERIRSMWKKREAAFTVELLKTIPPVPTCTQVQLPTTSQKSSVSAKQNKSHQTSPASSRGLSLNDEYPCKICGKIFSKVKSRSAHMKSHRTPTPPSNSPAPVLSPASAATLLENKEKIADALQKHIFGKACANLAKSLQAASSPPTTPAPVAPFMPKIVKVESIANVKFETTALSPISTTTTTTTISAITSPTTPTTTPSCFQKSSPPPTAHPLQLQATTT